MRFRQYILHLMYLVLCFSNCIQEFAPPTQGYQNLLVVEAFLSNGYEPFEVTLSRTTRIDTTEFIPETGAEVSFSEDSGERYRLLEAAPGIYQYAGFGTRYAHIGKSYRIHIRTQDGNEYESSSVTMRETPAIDSVTYNFEERPGAGTEGVQIYVNTHDANNNTWYYRWDWNETWEIRTPYESFIVWEDGEIKPREENIYNCWKFGRSTSIDISTSRNLTEDRISDFPLLFVTTETDRLRFKYSINVKQYALSEASYNYWQELKKATENLGTLFDPQPSIVMGNIQNINNKDEVVLGYFDASSVQETRIFITRGDLPGTRLPNFFSYCTDSIVTPNRVEEMINGNWMLASETFNEMGFPMYQMSIPACIDCTIYGTNVRPDYWD